MTTATLPVTARPNFTMREDEVMSNGHLACPGCGAPISMRMALKALGRRVMIAGPACCWSVIDGPFPYSCTGVPFLHCAFETAAITASGIRAALDMQGVKDVTVMAWAGDGGTFDIGIQALSGTAERNDDILYVCYDNEAYMNTGVQRSSATPAGAWTTTTPVEAPKPQSKKDIGGILAAHKIPYFATATVAFPDDFMRKFEKAKSIKGTRFLHLLSPCTAGWKCEERLTFTLARLGVNTKIFPLYEIENGEKYTINVEPEGLPVQEFTKLQGRFSHLKPADLARLQAEVDHRWERLQKMAAL